MGEALSATEVASYWDQAVYAARFFGILIVIEGRPADALA